MYSARSLKHDNLGLSNAHAFVSIVNVFDVAFQSMCTVQKRVVAMKRISLKASVLNISLLIKAGSLR